MKKIAALLLMLLPLVLLGQRCAQAGLLGVAGEYNVFVFGNIEQWGTDIEGRVAAGGIATYGRPDVLLGDQNGFAIASKTTDPINNLVAGDTVVLRNGSVGFLDLGGGSGGPTSQNGNIVYGGSVVPAIPPDVRYGSLQNGNPIDFAMEQSYLTALSGDLGSLSPNGSASILSGEIRLTGIDPYRNVFNLDASSIIPDIGFRFYAPETSTIIVNITGDAVLMRVGFFFNDIFAEPDHTLGYPYSHILFNFLDARDIDIDQIAIDGSLLAPFAHIDFGENSHIDGNLIASSLLGQGEAHYLPFNGSIAETGVPEPATLLLLAGGIACIVARRRNK